MVFFSLFLVYFYGVHKYVQHQLIILGVTSRWIWGDYTLWDKEIVEYSLSIQWFWWIVHVLLRSFCDEPLGSGEIYGFSSNKWVS